MKPVAALLTLSAVLISPVAFAEDQVISVPGEGWSIHFEAPRLTPTKGIVPSLFFGRADRLQISFFAEAPRCAGGDSDENIYACFTSTLKTDPNVVWESERGNTVPNGVLVMYMTRAEIDGKVGSAFNMNLLFAHNGKWADVHGSFASPKPEDVAALKAIIDSVKIEDEPAQPAAAKAKSSAR